MCKVKNLLYWGEVKVWLCVLLFILAFHTKGLYAASDYIFLEFFATAHELQKLSPEADPAEKKALLAKLPNEIHISNEKLLLLKAAINKDKTQLENSLNQAKKSNKQSLILSEEIKGTQLEAKSIMATWLQGFATLKQHRYDQEDIADLLNSAELSLNSIQFEAYEVQIGDLTPSNQKIITQQLTETKNEVNTYKEIVRYLRANSALLIDNYLLKTLAVDSVMAWLDQLYPIQIWRLSFGKLLICIIVCLLSWSLRWVLTKWTVNLISRLIRHGNSAAAQEDKIIVVLIRPISWILLFYSVDICLDVVYYPESPLEWMGRFFDIVYVIVVAWFMVTLLECYGAMLLMKLNKSRQKQVRAEIINLLLKFLYASVGLIALIVILARLDFDISAIIASLGIGGLAVALAAKDILANFFASVMLLFDNAFSQGDWIVCGDIEGTVVEIGLRRTSIRTFDNALLFVPNSLLVGSAIYNWNRRKVGRRIKMTVGITYSATADQLDQCIRDIRSMLEEHPGIAKISNYDAINDMLAFKRGLLSINDVEGNKSTIAVYLDNFGDSSIDIAISCFSVAVTHPEWTQAKQSMMFEIMRIVERNGLSFAFPSRSVYLENPPPSTPNI